MMPIRTKIQVSFHVTLQLDEVQARALDAMVGYGIESFLTTFYKMGTHYMQPYEGGMRSLFKAIEEQVRPELSKIDRARDAIRQAEKPKEKTDDSE